MPPGIYPRNNPNWTDDKKRAFAELIRDPVKYARVILRHDTWSTQERILRSTAINGQTAVKACHASGKTYCAAEAALWWITRFTDGIVITTAPTWNQVENVLWPEIHKAAANSRIRYPKFNETEIKLGDGRFAIGISTDQGVRFQGFHGRILIIIDEAPGVRQDIYEAIRGIRAGGFVHLLALGNPTIVGGPFYDAFGRSRASWKALTISAFDTPNLAGLSLETLLELPDDQLDANPRPYLVSRRWVKEMWEDCGEETNPYWQARVLGQFPEQDDSSLISLARLEAAKDKKPVDDKVGVLRAGVDVAGPGEAETTLWVHNNGNILHTKFWSKPDPRGDLVAELAQYRDRLDAVAVDSAGIGYYLGRHLADNGFNVRMVNVGTEPRNKDKFFNLKAELYWGLRQRFIDGDVAGLTDERTIAQLTGIRWMQTPRGQIKIESKDEARKRGVKSPDRAEGLMLAMGSVTMPNLLEFWERKAAASEESA